MLGGKSGGHVRVARMIAVRDAPRAARSEPANPRRLWSKKTDCSENGLGEPQRGSLVGPGSWQLGGQQRAGSEGGRLAAFDCGGDDTERT